jgi:hypothetical protein
MWYNLEQSVAEKPGNGQNTMVKTLVRSKHSMKQSHPVVSPIKRDFSPEEFDADTEEERPIAVLAERRKQFLAALEAKQSASD